MKHGLVKAILFAGLFISGPLLGTTRGGGSDGGACSVTSQGILTLKDFVRAGAVRAQNPSASPLQLGVVAQTIGFEMLNGQYGAQNIRQTHAYSLAMQILENWKSDSPTIISQIQGALESVQFAGVARQFRPFAFGCNDINDSPVIVYVGSMGFAYISVPTWNALTHEAQVGALFKESLRFLQAEMSVDLFQGEGLTERTEMLLSQIVSTLVTQSPRRHANSIDRIFKSYNIQTFGNSSKMMELSNKATQFCQAISFRGLSGCQAPQIRSVEDLTAFLPIAIAASQRLQNHFYNARLTDNQIRQLAARFETAHQILTLLLAEQMTLATTTPQNRAVVRQFTNINQSLQSCLQSRRGQNCQMNGVLAISSLSESIYRGEHTGLSGVFNSSLQSSIRSTQENFQRIAQQLMR